MYIICAGMACTKNNLWPTRQPTNTHTHIYIHIHGNGHMGMTTFVCLCVARVHASIPSSFYFSFSEFMKRSPNRMRPKSGAMQGMVCTCA